MRSIYRFISRGILGCALCFIHAGCTQIDDNRIPSVPVSINLADAGLWNVYGVSGFGVWRTFERDLGLPQGFHYTGTTYTLVAPEGTDGTQNTVIQAGSTSSVSFTNDYTPTDKGGGAVINQFRYEDGEGWGWTKIPDDEQ